MAKNSTEAYGATGKTNLLYFDPEHLTLVDDPASPLYDHRVHLPVNEELAKNIDYHGVLQPIMVSKNAETGKTEVVAGRQRTKAARLANTWRRERGERAIQIPAHVYRGNRREALAAMVGENELREGDTPVGRAEKMQRLMGLGYCEDDVGIVFGCGVPTVKATLALLDCCEDVRDAVETGSINLTQARHLSKLAPEQQREKVRELVAASQGAIGHARARAQRRVLGPLAPRMRTRKQIERELETCSGERAAALRWVLNLDALEENHEFDSH